MIVVDTSALIAILKNENRALEAMHAIADAERVLMSAATVAEALIVASRRGTLDEMQRLLEGLLKLEIVDVTSTFAQRVAAAYDRWGKGVHPASLNFGDCFAYALAKERSLPLLYIGNDFSRTDIQAAI